MDEQALKELQALREETERLRLEAERARSEAAAAKEALAQIHLQNLQHCINQLALPSELKAKAFTLVTSSGLSDELQEQFVEFLGEVLNSAMELQKRTSQFGISNSTTTEMELPKPYQNIIQRNRQTKKLAQLS
jgi:uncharacterized protein (DUF3084 family)